MRSTARLTVYIFPLLPKPLFRDDLRRSYFAQFACAGQCSCGRLATIRLCAEVGAVVIVCVWAFAEPPSMPDSSEGAVSKCQTRRLLCFCNIRCAVTGFARLVGRHARTEASLVEMSAAACARSMRSHPKCKNNYCLARHAQQARPRSPGHKLCMPGDSVAVH